MEHVSPDSTGMLLDENMFSGATLQLPEEVQTHVKGLTCVFITPNLSLTHSHVLCNPINGAFRSFQFPSFPAAVVSIFTVSILGERHFQHLLILPPRPDVSVRG